jgi:pseudouridine kinase
LDKRIGPFDSVTVFGGANVDRVAATSGPATLGVSNPGKARASPGGVAFNVAANLARLGRPVRLIARVGADEDGAAILAAAEAAGVDTAGIGVSPITPTATYQAAFDEAGGLIIGIADMTVCDELTPSAVARAADRSPDRDLWVVDANLPADTLDFLVGEARNAGRPVAALAVSPAKAVRLSALLDRLGLVFANRREAAALLDRPSDDKHPSASDLARALSSAYASNIVVTNGSDPLAVAAGGDVRSFAPLRAEVRSVNGAGDALAAGTIHGLAAGRSLFEAILPGLAAAAMTVEAAASSAKGLSAAALMARIAAGSHE